MTEAPLDIASAIADIHPVPRGDAMTSSAAAVIDLQEFRARRAPRPEPRPMTATQRAVAPFWVVWVPVWPVR
jgi:hypothetical protein